MTIKQLFIGVLAVGLTLTLTHFTFASSARGRHEAGAIASRPSAKAAKDPVQSADGLFKPVTSRSLHLAQSATIVRARPVEVDFAQLDALKASPLLTNTSREIQLNLFDDTVLTFIVERVERNASGSYTLVGHLEDVPFSFVALTILDQTMYGNIIAPGMVYEIRQLDKDTHLIAEINQSAFTEGIDTPITAPEKLPAITETNPQAPTSPMTDDGSQIDVLVAYTDDARNALGGDTQMQVLIDNAVQTTNTSYANSGINQHIRLSASVMMVYNETASMKSRDILNQMHDGTSGFADLNGFRNAYAADMVILIVENTMVDESGNGVAGEAYDVMGTVSTNFASSAYAVVQRIEAVNNLSFPHELGHLMGARHDWYADATKNSPYSYNHGYVNVAGGWRTVMAYNRLCQAQTPSVNCTRITYWSNPNVSYGGQATGVSAGTSTSCSAGSTSNPNCDADNHSTLNNTAFTASNFRPGNLANPTVNPSCNGSNNCFRTVTEAVFRAAPGSTITISPGNYPETLVLVNKDPRGLLINRPVTLRSDGTVVIGQ